MLMMSINILTMIDEIDYLINQYIGMLGRKYLLF
jgi:hypothetical protein